MPHWSDTPDPLAERQEDRAIEEGGHHEMRELDEQEKDDNTLDVLEGSDDEDDDVSGIRLFGMLPYGHEDRPEEDDPF
jgi:hypothetical protein